MHKDIPIFIGSDYRGDSLKKHLIDYLKNSHDFLMVSDCGSNSTEPDDYNDTSKIVIKKILETKGSTGILICASGHGMNISANRKKGIRATNCSSTESARLAREHENANILCLASDLVSEKDAEDIVKTFFHTQYTPLERRERRIAKLDIDSEGDNL